VLSLEETASVAQDRQDMWGREEAPPPRAAAPKVAPKADVPWDDQADDDLAIFQRLANDN
jgi:hypothetical protein